MRNYFVLLAIPLLLMGCAVQQIQLSGRAVQTYRVPVKKLVVDNLSTESKITVDDVVYVNGWAPMHSGFKPPLNESFASKVKNSIVAVGDSGRVDVAVIRVGLFVQQSIADDVVFVGLFTVGKDRGFKCDADVNVKTETESARLTLTYETRRPYFSNVEQVRQFVEACQTDLVRQLSEKIAKGS